MNTTKKLFFLTLSCGIIESEQFRLEGTLKSHFNLLLKARITTRPDHVAQGFIQLGPENHQKRGIPPLPILFPLFGGKVLSFYPAQTSSFTLGALPLILTPNQQESLAPSFLQAPHNLCQAATGFPLETPLARPNKPSSLSSCPRTNSSTP